MFDHTLHRESIFDIPNLVELSKRLPGGYYSTSDAGVEDGWKTGSKEPTSLPETIATIAHSNSLVLLKGLAGDGEFGPVLRRVLDEVQDQVGEALRADVSEGRATLVISSPGRITPYHIDAEANFLLQLRGEKIVNIFDPSDRTLLTDPELEAFYAGDVSAATYKPERQRDAAVFDFAPGKGLHLPILAPHWTRNGDSVSVAISINCSLHSNRRLANIYKFNNSMRKRGLVPSSPGTYRWRDELKAAGVEGFGYARRLLRRNATRHT
jgi:hypothetical protein